VANLKTLTILVLITIFIIGAATSISFLHAQFNKQSPLPVVGPGLVLVYRLTIQQPSYPIGGDYARRVGLLKPSQVINDSFYLDIKGSYRAVLSQASRHGGATFSNASTDCQVISKDVYLVIKVLSVQGNVILANVTLTLTNGAAECGIDYPNVPSINSEWNSVNGSRVASFHTLNLTKTVTIDMSSSNVKDPDGYPLGEWPFWLTTNDLSRSYTLVLYGLMDNVLSSFPVQGVADIIPLNNSQVSPTPFSVSGITVQRNDQIYIDKTQFPIERIIENVPQSIGERYVSQQERLYRTYSASSQCPIVICSLAFSTGGLASAEYVNGSVILDYNPVLDKMALAYKSWQFDPRLFAENGTANINGSEYRTLSYYPGIRYNGSSYVSYGFGVFAELRDASFSKSGILLYAVIATQEDLYSVLPAPIDRAFGVTIGSKFGGNQISLKLVEVKS
jgi:hypothetical protein